MTTTWTELRAIAVIGTERKPPGGLAVAGRDLARASDPERTLAAAALLGMERRAGQRTGVGVPPGPAPPERRPSCSAQATQLLDLLTGNSILDSNSIEPLQLLWLGSCVAAGQVVAPSRVVTVLERATSNRRLRSHAATAVGERGAWLARLRPEWSWASGGQHEVDAIEWDQVTGPVLHRAFGELRQIDPEAARSRLEASWDTYKAADRAALIGVLGDKLSSDDEPFLEAALDDRAKSVREAAAKVLVGLPDSARARRMADRLSMLVEVRGRMRRTLTVERPSSIDAAGVRDGLHDAIVTPSLRSVWLQDIVAGAPLQWWTETLERRPEQVVSLGATNADLMAGWSAAAAAQRDVLWAESLFGRVPAPALVPVLPPQEREALVINAIRSAKDFAAVVRLVEATPGPWTRGFAAVVIARLSVEEQYTRPLAELIRSMAVSFPPAATSELERMRLDSTTQPATRHALRDLLTGLSLRTAIAEAFAATGGPTPTEAPR